ncbi:MAG: ImmA/IrrE family metallo-endopeptidase [Lachnospiraceae bacterium]|nr:ImmA/IrrE family metallo-endopeptidase [Lachnospiraceae bacterium]
MNNEMRIQINALAEDIIKIFDIPTPIEDIDVVVETLGGKIQEDMESGSFSDGKIEREEVDGKFLIKIPYGQSESRKNFTVAHELGHLFLHMGYLIDAELWEKSKNKTFYRKGNSEIELQANEFAAAFLMPRKKYKEILDKYSESNYVLISKVADYFNVSIDAASYRGKWLGYLEW